ILQLDDAKAGEATKNLTQNIYRGLRRCLRVRADYILLLEDDLQFNRFFWHNLQHWAPLVNRKITLAGFYNPGHRVLACDLANRALIIKPASIYGGQAFLLSRRALKHGLKHLSSVDGMPGVKLPPLAAPLKQPVDYPSPFLVS